MPQHLVRTALSLSLTLSLTGAIRSQSVPNGFTVDAMLTTGLTAPNDFCFLPDGRVLIGDADGTITLFANGATAVLGVVPGVDSSAEGLLSIEADPGFEANGHIFVFYPSALDAFLHVDRFTCVGDRAKPTSTALALDVNSRRAVLDALVDNSPFHNGGSLRFGPDRRLYVSVGDDEGVCAAQNPASTVGCLLRMNVAGLPLGGSAQAPPFAALDPGNNPLSAANDFSQLVIARGLRNPFRMEIDAATGDVYLGDVGENELEEYSVYEMPNGPLPLVDFGWPWFEGSLPYGSCPPPRPVNPTAPIATVARATSFWFAIIGGPRYRNQGGPHDFGWGYEGTAFFLDYFQGGLRRIAKAPQWGPAPAVPGQPTALDWGAGFDSVTALRQGPDGALWFTERKAVCALRRIRPQPGSNVLFAVSGTDQIGPWGEPLSAPLVVQVVDGQGNPLANTPVTFVATGGSTLSTANPVLTDVAGFATTTVLSPAAGAFTVTANSPSAGGSAVFSLFGRRLQASTSLGLLMLSLTNTSPSVPPQVPHVVLMTFPGAPRVPSFVGPLCTDPASALTMVLEDSIGTFGGGSMSGSGAVGTPGFVNVYSLPPGLLTGHLMRFQAIGLDPVLGWYRTNCETRQF